MKEREKRQKRKRKKQVKMAELKFETKKEQERGPVKLDI